MFSFGIDLSQQSWAVEIIKHKLALHEALINQLDDFVLGTGVGWKKM